jgi:hypothetical protein
MRVCYPAPRRVARPDRGEDEGVWADFVLTEEGEKSRGRLVLLLIEEHESFKIHSLMFQYD